MDENGFAKEKCHFNIVVAKHGVFFVANFNEQHFFHIKKRFQAKYTLSEFYIQSTVYCTVIENVYATIIVAKNLSLIACAVPTRRSSFKLRP